MKKQKFLIEIQPFKSAVERYGTWPITVWDCDLSDKLTQQLKNLIGDDPYTKQSRVNLNQLQSTGKNSCYGKKGKKIHVSVFNPIVAVWLMNMYAPESGICFDPFAGGGARAIVALNKGMEYHGVELRSVEVEEIERRIKNNCKDSKYVIYNADACYLKDLIPNEFADYLITCPPYWSLEMYNGGECDLSMAPSYTLFLDRLHFVIEETYRILKPDTYSCWVVGLHRHKNGELIPLHHDITRLHQEVGFRLKEEIVLNQVGTGAIQRVGNFEKGNKYLIRTHEYALVFEK